MTEKHTPGPWTRGNSIEGRCCVFLDGHTESSGKFGPCDTWIDCNTEANARLVSAAPDMLAALLFVADIIDDTGSLAHRIVSAAIAKAEGAEL